MYVTRSERNELTKKLVLPILGSPKIQILMETKSEPSSLSYEQGGLVAWTEGREEAGGGAEE